MGTVQWSAVKLPSEPMASAVNCRPSESVALNMAVVAFVHSRAEARAQSVTVEAFASKAVMDSEELINILLFSSNISLILPAREAISQLKSF